MSEKAVPVMAPRGQAAHQLDQDAENGGDGMRRHVVDERAVHSIDRVFFALADPTRRRLLDQLYERDGQRLRELTTGFDISRQAVSKHLDVLADAGLIVVRRGEHRAPEHYLNHAILRHALDRWIKKYLHSEVSIGTA